MVPRMTQSQETWFGRIAGQGARMLRAFPPEVAHDIAIRCLAADPLAWFPAGTPDVVAAASGPDMDLRVSVPGIGTLAHPIGLAAGFDKNARAVRGLSRIGFSHMEIGAVTPRAQPGNPRPRLFRYPADESLINRMGFNNDGAEKIASRLRALHWNHGSCPVGVNIGKNKDTPASHAIEDFLKVHDAFKDAASFFVVNLSSPNTPGLRELATPAFLGRIADAFGPESRRLWIKFDPDMSRDVFQELVRATGDRGFAGLVLTNTHRVEHPQAGGLSGAPLTALSNRTLEWAWEVHRGSIPTIGVGGVMTGRDAFDKIARGSLALQIYTAFIYRGPWVVVRMLRELKEEMRRRGFRSVTEVFGSYHV